VFLRRHFQTKFKEIKIKKTNIYFLKILLLLGKKLNSISIRDESPFSNKAPLSPQR